MVGIEDGNWCAAQRIAGRRRGWRAGLAHFHVDDVAARLFCATRSFHHIHHDKGINRSTP